MSESGGYMMNVIAFLCAAAISPVDCNRTTAADVIPMGESANELTCIADAQTTLAALAIRSDAQHYWKITCQREGRADVG